MFACAVHAINIDNMPHFFFSKKDFRHLKKLQYMYMEEHHSKYCNVHCLFIY